MTEQPLFQNTDEQEAAYAPQQLPDRSDPAQGASLEGSTSADATAQPGVVPTAVAGVARTASGISYTSGLSHTEPGGIRARGAEALTADAEQDEDTPGQSA